MRLSRLPSSPSQPGHYDLRIKTFSFLHNRQLMHAISARAQRLTQDLTFPVLYPQVTTEWHIKHRMPDEL